MVPTVRVSQGKSGNFAFQGAKKLTNMHKKFIKTTNTCISLLAYLPKILLLALLADYIYLLNLFRCPCF